MGLTIAVLDLGFSRVSCVSRSVIAELKEKISPKRLYQQMYVCPRQLLLHHSHDPNFKFLSHVSLMRFSHKLLNAGYFQNVIGKGDVMIHQHQ